jgi:hypothetical protein
MRRLTAVVFGTIGLLVAAATARAIENHTWYSDGTIVLDVRTSGMPRFTAVGPFTETFTGALSDQVFFSLGQVDFTTNATATVQSVFPGDPTFEPISFSQTTAKFNVDFDAEPGNIDFASIITNFTDNLVTELLDQDVAFVGSVTVTAEVFQGIQVLEPTLKASGKLKAFDDFTMAKGGFTISCKGMTFIEGDTKENGRKTKIVIKLVSLGSLY